MVAFSSCCCCTSEAVETVLVALLLCVQTDEFKEDCSEVHSGTRKATVMYLVKAPEKLVRTCSTFLFRENKRQVVSCNYVTNPKTTDANLHACKYVCVCVCVILLSGAAWLPPWCWGHSSEPPVIDALSSDVLSASLQTQRYQRVHWDASTADVFPFCLTR